MRNGSSLQSAVVLSAMLRSYVCIRFGPAVRASFMTLSVLTSAHMPVPTILRKSDSYRPASTASRMRSALVLSDSRFINIARCIFTVFSATLRSAAICLLSLPLATSFNI
jgi:hypothetical protein